MGQLKRYNPITQEWEPTIAGAQGPQGPQGPQGATGEQGVVSASDPLIYDSENQSISFGSPNYITFDTTPETSSVDPGTVYWDSGEGTPTVILNSDVSLNLGQENVALCYNGTGSTITNGSAVYISGVQGQRPSISLADADTENTSSKTFGVATEDILDGQEGFITTFGIVNGINTSSFTDGQVLWLSSTAGQITATKPAAPTHTVFVGYCLKSHASSGRIFVNPQNGYELDELHDVGIDSPVAGEIILRNSTNTLWENYTLAEAGISEIGHTHDDRYYTKTEVNDALDTKANVSHNHDDRYYTEAETDNAISVAIANVIDTAPALMDTLNELSASLNNDPNFSTTVANALAALVPAGTITQTARASAPTGYLLCDGSAISRTTYSALFDAIGTAYGNGDGSTTFNIPNLKGRVPVGYDPSQTEFDALGEAGGAKTHTLSANQLPSHTHSGTTGNQSQNHTHGYSGTVSGSGAHNHLFFMDDGAASFATRYNNVGTYDATSNNSSGNGGWFWTASGNSAYDGTHSHTYSGTTAGVSQDHTHSFTTDGGTGGGQAHNNLQPYVVLNYMIKI